MSPDGATKPKNQYDNNFNIIRHWFWDIVLWKLGEVYYGEYSNTFVPACMVFNSDNDTYISFTTKYSKYDGIAKGRNNYEESF